MVFTDPPCRSSGTARNSAHRGAKSRYSQRYQRSIDCQQPQQRRRTETTAAYPEDVREWLKVEQHCGNPDNEPSRYAAINPTSTPDGTGVNRGAMMSGNDEPLSDNELRDQARDHHRRGTSTTLAT
jgi:hypothetical protein